MMKWLQQNSGNASFNGKKSNFTVLRRCAATRMAAQPKKDFGKYPCQEACNREVDFENLYISIFLYSDIQFVFFEKN